MLSLLLARVLASVDAGLPLLHQCLHPDCKGRLFTVSVPGFGDRLRSGHVTLTELLRSQDTFSEEQDRAVTGWTVPEQPHG